MNKQVSFQHIRVQDQTIEVIMQISAELPYFKGHFEGMAILPGVVQILWAEAISRKHFNLGGGYSGMQKIKFKSVVQPGTNLKLTLKNMDNGKKVHFSYRSDKSIHAEGYLLFEK